MRSHGIPLRSEKRPPMRFELYETKKDSDKCQNNSQVGNIIHFMSIDLSAASKCGKQDHRICALMLAHVCLC